MKLTLIRGLPGSGKSTLAKSLPGIYFEADQFFIDPVTNVYNFNIDQIEDAHDWCQNNTEIFLERGFDVNVSNTFTTIRELRPYFEIAKQFKIVPVVITCQNQFGNIHNAPIETYERMKKRFTWDISSLFEESETE